MSASCSGPITLDSRYTELDRPVLMTGIQALVRVLLEQARLDRQRAATPAGWYPAIVAPPSAGSTRSCGGARRC